MLSNLQFRFPWREYQARVLEHLDLYREDRKIHIVAPPGAGKTVLGLEIVRRYNRQTLILAPSLTIRNQWTERLIEDFGGHKKMVSSRLDQPAEITVVTYQALYQYMKKEEQPPLDWIEVLVVDECHHLRREWWRTLDKICQEHNPELVALTATPPFDVSGLEWRRYHDFCGEIDEEITIPELVSAGDLCYHQDYVYPVLPETDLVDRSRLFAQQKVELYETLYEMRPLAEHLLEHPWLTDPEKHYEAIFNQPEYFSALLVVLRYLGSEPPAAALGVLHDDLTVAPQLSDEWLTIFLQRGLREDDHLSTPRGREILRPLRRQLTQMGAWDDGKLHLDEPPGLSGKIRNSSAKIRAVRQIVAHEWEQLGDELRMVILADHINAELLPTTKYDRSELTKLSVSTLFEQIRRDGTVDENQPLSLRPLVAQGKLSVLTGSVVVIPAAAEHRLLDLAYAELPVGKVIKTKPLFPGSDYLVVQADGLSSKNLVKWITQLFTEGAVNVIVGTKSLLGEGWDAPAINSLVLASTVGTFVTSNQMRGRAIRTNPSVPDKTANIWHPVTYNPGMPRGGSDMRGLERRFKAFAGPTLSGAPVIMSGLRRYDMDWSSATISAVEDFGRDTLKYANHRHELADRWEEALQKGEHLVEAVAPPRERHYRKKDMLSRHFYLRADRRQQTELRQFHIHWKVGIVVAFIATTLLLIPLRIPQWAGGLALLGFLAFSVNIYYRLSRLWSTRRRLGLSPREARIMDGKYLLFPLLAALAFLAMSWMGPLLFLLLFAAYLLPFQPVIESDDHLKRFEILASARQRLERYGRAIVKSLADNSLLHSAGPDQLRLEADPEEDRHLAFLGEAEHHDNHLFADSMRELMQPVENPRFLLRLEQPPEWVQGEYYLPVPAALGKTKAQAESLRQNLSRELGQAFTLVYTREPAGRLHLLTAKLQLAERSEDREAQREILWR